MGAININSLPKHIEQVKMFVDNNPLDILAVNKTKIDSLIPDTQNVCPGTIVFAMITLDLVVGFVLTFETLSFLQEFLSFTVLI